MQDSHSANPIVQSIHIILHSLSCISILVFFIWISGYINLPEHDAVDLSVKQSLLALKMFDPSPTLYTTSEFITVRSFNLLKFWATQSTNKLKIIKKLPIPWSFSIQSFRFEKISFTCHPFPPFSRPLCPPSCRYCPWWIICTTFLFGSPTPFSHASHPPFVIIQNLSQTP